MLAITETWIKDDDPYDLNFDGSIFIILLAIIALIGRVEELAYTLNLSKTWEMLIHGKTTKPNPQPVPGIERKSWLKLLGIIFQENPCCWDLHVDKLIAKASSRLYILRVCKFYGYSQDQLNKLFDSLILSLFAYGLEVWGSASKKYLDPIDNFCKRAYRYGYTAKADFEI